MQDVRNTPQDRAAVLTDRLILPWSKLLNGVCTGEKVQKVSHADRVVPLVECACETQGEYYTIYAEKCII